ncbi:MAG: sulfotransferase [Oscillatoria sp. SIO1A7]|nr:sulfotransferase [Oscillatoria sp. SIO1A7]
MGRCGDQFPIFLVGCPRSGTTLLQSMLAAHPAIASFPETKFFFYGVPQYEPKRQAFGMVSRQLNPWLREFFTEHLKRPELLQSLPRIPLMSLYLKKMIGILESLTKEQGKSIWLEKTPEHLYYVETIEKLIAGVRFIHIVRNGADVVASLYEVTHKYPKPWKGALDIDRCIGRWLEAIPLSDRHLQKPNHTLVRYENLVEEPRSTLVKICDFLGIEFDDSMLDNFGSVAQQVSMDEAGRSVGSKIKSTNSQKFYEIFDESQRQYILNRISAIDLDRLNSKAN